MTAGNLYSAIIIVSFFLTLPVAALTDGSVVFETLEDIFTMGTSVLDVFDEDVREKEGMSV